MKIAMIGASGHGLHQCMAKAGTDDRNFTAIAPGSTGEQIDHAVRRMQDEGYCPKVYENYRTMLLKEKIDVVVVDNFYGEHALVIADALKAGCHVYAEKPMAANVQQLNELYMQWRAAGTQLCSMLNYRYNGAFYCAHELIRQGAIGKVRLMNAQKSYKYGVRSGLYLQRATYGGTIPWVGIHAIDWVLWLSGGRMKSVWAVQSAMDSVNGISPETTALAQFMMHDGVMASVTMDMLNPQKAPVHGDDRIRVVGTTGVLEVRSGAVTLINENGTQTPENLPNGDLFTEFLQQVNGTGICRLSAEEAFASTRAALFAQAAADQNEILDF